MLYAITYGLWTFRHAPCTTGLPLQIITLYLAYAGLHKKQATGK
jgi:hypothetical protein